MKLPVKDNSPLISSGKHLVEISKVYEDEAGSGETQLAVLFKAVDGDRQITKWYNLKGFKKDPESPKTVDENGRTVDNWLRNKKGDRIEDKDSTNKCMSILSQLLFDAGLGEDEDGNSVDTADTDDLEGCQLGIFVGDRDTGFGTRTEVKYTMPASKAYAQSTIDDLI